MVIGEDFVRQEVKRDSSEIDRIGTKRNLPNGLEMALKQVSNISSPVLLD